jgi:hypothetical protein
MAITHNYSNRQIDGTNSASLKKPTTLYISETDGRNDREYIKNFPGTVYVLSEKEFSKWLAAEYLDPDSEQYYEDGEVLNNSVANTLYGQVDTSIRPPTNLLWDQKDIKYITSDNAIFQNIVISFDESATDDGTYEYQVFYESTGPANQAKVPTSQTAKNTVEEVANVKIVTKTSSLIKLSWNQIPSAVSYEVIIEGTNIPGTKSNKKIFLMPSEGGQSKTTALCTGSLSSKGSVYSWNLAKSGSANFSGTYDINIKVIYKTGSSKNGVNKSVTIV